MRDAFKDLSLMAQIKAAELSVEWVYQYAEQAKQFETRLDLIVYTLSLVSPIGDLAEFGVFEGAVTNVVHRHFPQRRYHVFDSFAGVPKQMAFAVAENSFDLKGQIPALPAGVLVYPGWFNDTVPEWAAAQKDPLAFVYVDCDVYESVKTVLDSIAPLLVHDSILAFDDYYNFPNWPAHSHRAFEEMKARTGLMFTPIATTTVGHAVAFQRRA